MLNLKGINKASKGRMMATVTGEREAKIHYLSGDYDVIEPGTFVRCAVTGEKIPLDCLRYWNFERQEAYSSCEISYKRELECDPRLRTLFGTTI